MEQIDFFVYFGVFSPLAMRFKGLSEFLSHQHNHLSYLLVQNTNLPQRHFYVKFICLLSQENFYLFHIGVRTTTAFWIFNIHILCGASCSILFKFWTPQMRRSFLNFFLDLNLDSFAEEFDHFMLFFDFAVLFSHGFLNSDLKFVSFGLCGAIFLDMFIELGNLILTRLGGHDFVESPDHKLIFVVFQLKVSNLLFKFR